MRVRCKPDLPDECAVNYGGCWHGDFSVSGRMQTFNACRDDIDKYKVCILRRCLPHLKSIRIMMTPVLPPNQQVSAHPPGMRAENPVCPQQCRQPVAAGSQLQSCTLVK